MSTRAATVTQFKDQMRWAEVGWAIVSVVVIGGVTWYWGGPERHSYVWLDVAAVYLLAALPLAAAVWMWMRSQSLSGDLVGAGAMGLAVVGWFTGLQPLEQPWLRLAAALCVAIGLVGLVPGHLRRQRRTATELLAAQQQTLAVVGCGVLMVVPWVYVQARCRHDIDQVVQMLEQSRIGEAYELSSRVLSLMPDAQLNGRGLSELNRDLAAVVEQLRQRVARPLAADVSDEQWLARVRDLAILGECTAALGVMAADPARLGLPEACNLRGTILETLHRWQPAGEAYAAAKAAWESRPPSPEQQAGLVQALTGIAYTERKRGRYLAAEAAYQQRLAIAPTADSHFLLAQFYDETQRAALARAHVRQAMQLAPERYQQSGTQLLNKLASFHFGCFQN